MRKHRFTLPLFAFALIFSCAGLEVERRPYLPPAISASGFKMVRAQYIFRGGSKIIGTSDWTMNAGAYSAEIRVTGSIAERTEIITPMFLGKEAGKPHEIERDLNVHDIRATLTGAGTGTYIITSRSEEEYGADRGMSSEGSAVSGNDVWKFSIEGDCSRRQGSIRNAKHELRIISTQQYSHRPYTPDNYAVGYNICIGTELLASMLRPGLGTALVVSKTIRPELAPGLAAAIVMLGAIDDFPY